MENWSDFSGLTANNNAENADDRILSMLGDPYFNQPTSDQRLATGGRINAAEDGTHVRGPSVANMPVDDRSEQVFGLDRAPTNTARPSPAQTQLPDSSFDSIDQILKDSREQQEPYFKHFLHSSLDAPRLPSLPFEALSSPDQSSNEFSLEHSQAPAGQSQYSHSLPDSNLNPFEPMPHKRPSCVEPQYSDTNDPRFDYRALIEPSPKRKRTKTSLENHSPGRTSTRPPLSYPGPKPHTIWAYALWALCNPGKQPTEQTKQELSDVCGEEDSSAVDSILAANERAINEQHTPKFFTEAACELWKAIYPNEEPARWHKTMLSGLFGGSDPKSVSNWFTRKQEHPPSFNDSGFGTMTQTGTSVDREIAVYWRYNRKHCLRTKKQPPPHGNLQRDKERKFICTSLCGQTFDSQESWKRHERSNRMQKVYPCDLPSCREDPGSFIWSRKDELDGHIKSHHHDQKDSYNPRYIEIRANVRGNCLWRHCPAMFTSFDEFTGHMTEHFNNHWVAADLRGSEEETNAPSSPQPAHNSNQDHDPQDSDDENEGSPSPNAGGPSSGHQASQGYGSGSGNPDTGSGHSAPKNSGTGRTGASGNNPTTYSSNAMQLKGLSPVKTLHHSASTSSGTGHSLSGKQTWQGMISWSPTLNFLRRLGSGATAVVDEVTIPGVSGTWACKSFAARWHKELFQELKTMSTLRHPHIVELFHPYLRAGFASILMHPVADYNLSQYLAQKVFTPTEQCNMWLWFSCLTSGLHHMHEHGVVHHDVKPSNILVMDRTVFYSDFGSSASMGDDQAQKLGKWAFTKTYAAPEVLIGDRRKASDIFSLGCVFLEMLTVLLSKDLHQQLLGLQAQPYQKNQKALHWASKWNSRLWALPKHQMKSSKVRDLLQICQTMTDPQPNQRPSAAEVDQRLSPRLCRSCSYSTKWRGNKASTWPLDQSSPKSPKNLNITDQGSAEPKESIPSKIDELSRTSQRLDQLSLADASEIGTEESLPETGENKTVKGISINDRNEAAGDMKTKYLLDQDPHEKFRVSGVSVSPNSLNTVGPRSQYPLYIHI